MGIKATYMALLKDLGAYYTKMSSRERGLVVVVVLVVGVILSFNICSCTNQIFKAQQAEMERAKTESESVALVLKNYFKFKRKRDAIENQYKEVEISEGALSYLENLVKTKAQIELGRFQISDSAAKPFGLNFEQQPFSIKFSTTNLQAFVEFLKELSEGVKPFVFSSLDLSRMRGSDQLQVAMEVSSVRRVKTK